MWNLISGLKTLRENSVQIFLLAIWSLDVLKRIVKIFPKILLNKEIKKAGLQFNPGLVLISLWTAGPRTLRKFIPGSCRWDWSKYVTSSVAPFHEVSFRHLVGKGSNLLLLFFSAEISSWTRLPLCEKARESPSIQANKQSAAKASQSVFPEIFAELLVYENFL